MREQELREKERQQLLNNIERQKQEDLEAGKRK